MNYVLRPGKKMIYYFSGHPPTPPLPPNCVIATALVDYCHIEKETRNESYRTFKYP